MVLNFFMRVQDQETYKRFKLLCIDNNVHIQDAVWQLIEKKVMEVDGQRHTLEKFFDKSFVPKPEIDDDLEKKQVPWFRTLDDIPLRTLRLNYGRGFIYTSHLLETPKPDRLTVELNHNLLWKRYWR